MAKKTYNITDLRSGNLEKNFPRKIGAVMGSNGEAITTGTGSEGYNIMRANKALTKNASSAPMNGTATELDQSVSMLETIGCCIVSKKEGFSLMDEQANREAIQNPNISGSVGNIKNKQTKADGQFTNPDDPFYNLDSKPTRQTELQNRSIKSAEGEKQIIKIGSDLAALNLSLSGTTLKYFR